MEKLKVNSDICIGCGLCVTRNEKHFEFNDEGMSSVKDENVQDDEKKELLDIVESCPVGAIVIEDEK